MRICQADLECGGAEKRDEERSCLRARSSLEVLPRSPGPLLNALDSSASSEAKLIGSSCDTWATGRLSRSKPGTRKFSN